MSHIDTPLDGGIPAVESWLERPVDRARRPSNSHGTGKGGIDGSTVRPLVNGGQYSTARPDTVGAARRPRESAGAVVCPWAAPKSRGQRFCARPWGGFSAGSNVVKIGLHRMEPRARSMRLCGVSDQREQNVDDVRSG